MKVILKNAIIKKILMVFITIIMVSNFIMPNYVFAQSPGEQLVSGFFYLLGYVGDIGIEIMQEIMIGNSDIGNDETGYKILYSPGMIFSNQVPALDINFVGKTIDPIPVIKTTEKLKTDKKSLTEIMEEFHYSEGTNQIRQSFTYSPNSGWTFSSIKDGKTDEVLNGNDETLTQYVNSGKIKSYPDNRVETGKMDYILYSWQYNGTSYEVIEFNNTKMMALGIMDKSNIVVNGSVESMKETQTEVIGAKKSTAEELKGNIATWYVALRTIALVGLLSVLVYLGIRMILSSSSAQDKAKYKNMLKDWLVAICILFVLHYIMAFMLNFTAKLNEIIKDIAIEYDSNGVVYDELMSEVRNNFSADFDNVWTDAPGRVIMYLALVILTGVFTFQYLKRVIFMAFLTMVAPMIALTYPLDKVKDGKAQAFSYWLKEYIFNCLIQPVHLLIYTILITNAITFATENMLYAIVALAFMVPAEKFIKNMFGMKSDSPTGQLGAAAGGAMVMSMLNKIKAKPPKDDAGSGSSNNGNSVRTANNRTATSSGGANGSNTGGANSSNAGGSSSSNSGSSSGPSSRGSSSSSTGGSSSQNGGSTRPGAGIRRAEKNLAIKGFDGIKSAGIGVLKKAPGAVLGATVGLAATVASGGENAMSFIGGGMAAGSALTSNIAGGIGKFGKDTYAEYQKGKYGQEAYQNRKFDKEFYKSDGYRLIEEDSSIQSLASSKNLSVKELTQTYLDAGITDASKIREALQNDITGAEYVAYSKAGIESPKKIANIKKNYTAEQAASRIALAKNAPKTLGDFKAMMVGRKFDGKTVTDADAERIYKELVDFF